MPLLSTIGSASLRGFGAFRPSGAAASFISATGGTVTTSGNYKYHSFTSSGTFTVTAAPSGKYVDFIIIAGGGGGAYQLGGGGGGVIVKSNQSITNGSYAVTVGAGGIYGSSQGTNGGNSVFNGLTALGGGGGGGLSGGSGGASNGAALQPTSASGGFGYAAGTGGGGGAGGVGGENDGGQGYYDATFIQDNCSGGGPHSTDGTYPGPGLYGEGGGYEDGTATGYNGFVGRVIIRYLYQ